VPRQGVWGLQGTFCPGPRKEASLRPCPSPRSHSAGSPSRPAPAPYPQVQI
jgi:hypothetical protein